MERKNSKVYYYRNKSIFGWDNFEMNQISSIESLAFMKEIKKLNPKFRIQNIIIRNIDEEIGIIIQANETFVNYETCKNFYKKILKMTNYLKLNLVYFSIQFKIDGKFIKQMNHYEFLRNFIKFTFYSKVISLLPDSFFQPNISVLSNYYDKFNYWIEIREVDNLINIGDDGGNVCTILSNKFTNMISLFHCTSSLFCALEMKKDNNINNLKLTYEIDDCINFDIENKNIILFINPGRKGLKDNEIKFIKKSKNIDTIIYMACNKKAFTKDLNKLKEFNIIDAISIDAMPGTKLVEDIFLLSY